MTPPTTTDAWAVSPDEAAALLGLTRRSFYRQVMPHVYSRAIKSTTIGRLRRIDVASLRAWWSAQIESVEQ